MAPADLDWLDLGCGTGALTEAICAQAAPASVLGCDPAAPFIEFARERAADARVSFAVAGVGDLPGRPGGYGSVTSLLALDLIPNPAGALDPAARAPDEGERFPICQPGAHGTLSRGRPRRGPLRRTRAIHDFAECRQPLLGGHPMRSCPGPALRFNSEACRDGRAAQSLGIPVPRLP